MECQQDVRLPTEIESCYKLGIRQRGAGMGLSLLAAMLGWTPQPIIHHYVVDTALSVAVQWGVHCMIVW